MIAEGMKLLGLVIESNDSSTTSALCSIGRHEPGFAILSCSKPASYSKPMRWGLLPAAGPMKVRDDRPQKPQGVMGHNGGPPLDGPSPFTPPPAAPPLAAPGGPHPPTPPLQPCSALHLSRLQARPDFLTRSPGCRRLYLLQCRMLALGWALALQACRCLCLSSLKKNHVMNLANALEKDFNHYLTSTAKEFVPDTDQMLFKVGFSGLGIKKVYNCPLRRRPVSESVDVEELHCLQFTHRPEQCWANYPSHSYASSTLKRMQILEVYRDVPIGQPTQAEDDNAVRQEKAEIAGVQPQSPDPRDADHVIFECYCELIWTNTRQSNSKARVSRSRIVNN